MSLLKHSPNFNCEEAARLAKDLYGIEAVARQLPSERDQNFLLTNGTGDNFVLKIANSLEQDFLLEAQNQVMNHLAKRVDFCPRVLPAKSGESIVQTVSTRGATHLVRLLSYIPGVPLSSATQSSRLLFDFGKKLGAITHALSDFDQAAFHRAFHWDLANGVEVIDEHISLIADTDLRERVDRFVVGFQQNANQQLAKLERSVIHGDANDYNVIVKDEAVVGLIDFGDMIYSYTVGELAIAIAYVVLDKTDPLSCAKEIVAGYVSNWSLTEDELGALWWLILMRLCMSVCLAAHQQRQQPENRYLDISQESIRESLPRLLRIDADIALDSFRAASISRPV